jgi:hypothetical protein
MDQEKSIVVKRIPIELWKRLKIKAVTEDRTIQAVVADAIQRYLESA